MHFVIATSTTPRDWAKSAFSFLSKAYDVTQPFPGEYMPKGHRYINLQYHLCALIPTQVALDDLPTTVFKFQWHMNPFFLVSPPAGLIFVACSSPAYPTKRKIQAFNEILISKIGALNS
jgi:hypothetical protein